MKLPLIRAGLVGVAAVVLVGATISPAMAAPARTLPAGEPLYAMSCDGSLPNGQLLAVDASTAVSTPVGSGTETADDCYGQSAWDAATKTAYTVAFGNFPEHLDQVNLTSGAVTTGPTFTLNGESNNPDAIAISPTGQAFATNGRAFYSLDLTTGALTLINPEGPTDLYGLAFDPKSGVLYAVDDDGVLYTINTSTGAATTITTLDLTPGDNEYSLQVASNGILWIENDGSGRNEADLWSVDPTAANIAASAVESGALNTTTGGIYYSESLLLVPTSDVTPTITSSNHAAATAGTAFTFTVVGTGNPKPAFTVTAGTLPAGVTLNPSTGVLSGTPTAAGTFQFTVTATNAAGTATQAFTLNVAAAAVAPAPTPTPAPTTPVVVVVHLPIVSG